MWGFIVDLIKKGYFCIVNMLKEFINNLGPYKLKFSLELTIATKYVT